MFSTRSFNAYKIHVRRKHSNVLGIDNDTAGFIDIRDNYGEHETELIPDINVHEQVSLVNEGITHDRFYLMLLAKYFLSLETEHKVSKVSINNISIATKNLMATICQNSADKLVSILRSLGKDEEEVVEIVSKFSSDLGTEVLVTADQFLSSHSRNLVYEKMCKLVSPEEVCLGFKNVRVRGKLKRQRVIAYYVPLKSMLEALLNLPEIWHWFKNPEKSADGIQRDVTDGEYFEKHPLNSDPHNFLALSLNVDDINLQNPLRSSQRYKLTMFYFQILNIPVQFRSKLSSVFLYGICKTKDIGKFGLKKFLQNFTQTVNQMATEGILMAVNGVEHRIKGSLLFSVADTPAAGMLSGMKESCFANRPCRRCLGDQNSIRQQFSARAFQLRDMTSHIEICQMISDPQLSKENRAFWSKMYGVKSLSPLCSISGFPVTNNILMDPMHLIPEGVACHLLALFFYRCIVEYGFFSLDWLNNQIQEYAFSEADKGHLPEKITRNQIVTDIHIKQKAVAMLSLLFCLPHILGPIFITGNDDHYKHFICLVKITQICFSPYSNENTHAELESLVEQFGSEWLRLYPMSRVRPKLHFLVHLVEQMRQFGSLHGLSCLRYEAKHGWFKDMRIKNFKNLPLSLSNKHQLYLCHKMIDIHGAPAKNFIYSGDEIGEGHVTRISRANLDIYNLLSRTFGIQQQYDIYETDYVNVNGIGYTNGCVLVLKVDVLGHPTFGQVENIFVNDEIKYFIVRTLEAVCYIWQLHSYKVVDTEDYDIIRWGELTNVFPLKVDKINNEKFVMNKYSEYTGPF